LVFSAFAGLPASAASSKSAQPAGLTAKTQKSARHHARPTPSRIAIRRAADVAALFKARSSGRPVPVTANTTQTSSTVANPNGTLATTIHALPVRVYDGGRWDPITTNLRPDLSGGYSPVTPSRLTLSSGGLGPLAVLAFPTGGTLTVGFPGRLPVPAVSGATAIYAVRPGTRLQVTATQTGGISISLLLTRVHGHLPAGVTLSLRTHNLQVQASRTGLAATDAAGVALFTGSVPQALVTARPGASARLAKAASLASGSIPLQLAGPSGQLSSARIFTAIAADETVCTSNPGSGIACSKLAPQTINVGYTDIGANCQQPTWNSASPATLAIGNQVFHGGCNGPDRAEFAFDVTGLDSQMKIQTASLSMAEDAGADWNCSNTWPAHLYWVSGVNHTTTWSNNPSDLGGGSPVHTDELKPAGCGTNGTVEFDYSVFNQVAASKTASFLDFEVRGAEPAGSGDPHQFAINNPNSPDPCGNGDSGNGLSAQGFNCGLMYLDNNPSITTVYDLVPDPPINLDTNPPAHTFANADPGCVSASGTLPWFGKTDGVTEVDLSAKISAPLTNEAVRALYTVNDLTGETSLNAGLGFFEQQPGDYSQYSGTSPSVTHTAIDFPGGQPADGHVYQWSAQADVTGVRVGNDSQNGPQTEYDSSSVGPCLFAVDETSPNPPTNITSTAFPPNGGGNSSGSSGTFTFSGGVDPNPPGCEICLASGIYGYAYALNPIGGINTNTPITTSGTTLSLKVNAWGDNALWVASIDKAGNYSQPVIYHFFVPANLSAVRMPGDVDGHGIPDLLAITSSGNLDEYPGPVNATLPAALVASGPRQSPDGQPEQNPPGQDDWPDFQITHRGSYSQNPGFDDLIAHVNTASDARSDKLYFYTNTALIDGNQPPMPFDNFSSNATSLSVHPNCLPTAENKNCGSYPGTTSPQNSTDWSDVTQILEPGDAWAGSSADNTCGSQPVPGVPPPPDTPSLLTVENGNLWLYQGGCGDFLNPGNPRNLENPAVTTTAASQPVELGAGDWGNMTLIAPGMVDGNLTLWARDNSSGALYSYTFTIDGNNVPTLSQPGSNGIGSPIPAEGSGSTGTLIPLNVNLSSQSYPVIASNGDDATGSPANLYFIGTSGIVWEIAGEAGPGDSSPLNANKTQIGSVPANSITDLS
jgi:hypothetical protein